MGPPGRSVSLVPGSVILVWPVAVGKTHDRVGIRDIKIVADKCDAERRVQMIEKDGPHFGDAVGADVAKKRDLVAAFFPRAGKRLHPAHDQVLGGG